MQAGCSCCCSCFEPTQLQLEIVPPLSSEVVRHRHGYEEPTQQRASRRSRSRASDQQCRGCSFLWLQRCMREHCVVVPEPEEEAAAVTYVGVAGEPGMRLCVPLRCILACTSAGATGRRRQKVTCPRIPVGMRGSMQQVATATARSSCARRPGDGRLAADAGGRINRRPAWPDYIYINR